MAYRIFNISTSKECDPIEIQNCKITGNNSMYELKDGKIYKYSIMGGDVNLESKQEVSRIELTNYQISLFNNVKCKDGNFNVLDENDLKFLNDTKLTQIMEEAYEDDNIYKIVKAKVTELSVQLNLLVNGDENNNVKNISIEFEKGPNFFQRLALMIKNKEEKEVNVIEEDIEKSTIVNTLNEDYSNVDQAQKDSIAFLRALGAQETKGIKNPYACKNKYGYVGLYQMGEQAMADMGIYKKTGEYNNDWSGFFVKNKYGITSLWDYQNSPEKQDKLQLDYKKKNWTYIKNLGLHNYIGKTINGVEITASGLLAGAHLVGVGGLKKFLVSNGDNNISDATGTPVSKYIAQFAGYDVSSITS